MARLLFFLLVAVLSLVPPAGALEIEPFYTRNQSPLVQIFGLPPAEGGKLAGPGRTEARLVLDVANIFCGDENDHNAVQLDGETYRLTLAVRRGLGKWLELGLDLPYVWHSGGNLDGFIDGFHRTFNLPEGGRDLWERDEFEYIATVNGEPGLQYLEPQEGPGDLLLTAAWSLLREELPEGFRGLALRTALKLPTGDADDLTGSGSTDVSLRMAYSDGLSLADRRLSWFGALGGMLLAEGDVLPELQEDLVFFGNLGAGWRAYDWLNLQVQFDGHTPFYEGSDLRQLDETSVQVMIGFSAALPGETRLDFAVIEDLVVDTAPDVVFHLALRHRF